MVQLKQLRTSRGLTQKQIAKMLKTTHQTIARWEAGKTDIPDDALKNLAVILRCTTDAILSTEAPKQYGYKPSNTFIDCLFELEKKTLFGGLRLQFDLFDRAFNFPINGETDDDINLQVKSVGEIEGSDWLIVNTMDNWRLFINLHCVTCLETYSFDTEEPPAYELPEVYKALTNTAEIDKLELPDALRSYCREKDRKFERMHDYSLWDYYNQAIIYTRRGKEINIFLDEDTSLEFANLEADYIGYDNSPYFLKFISEDSKGHQAINVDHVALAMVPLVAYRNYIDDEEAESDEPAEKDSSSTAP
jgi:transcriptional regulator with XRE-family HTH domain